MGTPGRDKRFSEKLRIFGKDKLPFYRYYHFAASSKDGPFASLFCTSTDLGPQQTSEERGRTMIVSVVLVG